MELTRLEASFDVLVKLAVKGNAKALALYMMAQKEASEAAKEFRAGILLAANEHIDRWLHVFLLNERNGKPMPPFVYPDPRDIIINPDGSVEIVGPINMQQHLLVDEMMHHRDEHIEVWDKVLTVCTYSRYDLEREWRKRSKLIEKMTNVLPPRLRKSLPPLEKCLPGRSKREPDDPGDIAQRLPGFPRNLSSLEAAMTGAAWLPTFITDWLGVQNI